MHEVAIAQGILEVVLDVAAGHEVRTVRVRAGELQAVTEESLQFCFELVAQETPAATARVEVETVPGDELSIEAIELDDGWQFRPDALQHAGTPT
jgi:hydrogenase nickel incorporation protein HypA/HybF